MPTSLARSVHDPLMGVRKSSGTRDACTRAVDGIAVVAGMMMASFSEGLKLASEVGVDQGTLLEAIGISAIAAPMYKLKARAHCREPARINSVVGAA